MVPSPPPEVTVEDVGTSSPPENEDADPPRKAEAQQGNDTKMAATRSSPPLTNDEIRPIDVYGDKHMVTTHNLLQEQSRESSRAQVAQAKQTSTERWVMLHQWPSTEGAPMENDLDWLDDDGLEISPEAAARADAIARRGDSYKYETRRKTTDKKYMSAESSASRTPEDSQRWAHTSNGEHHDRPHGLHGNSKHHTSPPRRRRKNLANTSSLMHRHELRTGCARRCCQPSRWEI